MGPNKTSSKKGKKSGYRGTPHVFREDYEYFQLYDPDDSDLDSETDPDVRSLLVNGYNRIAAVGSVEDIAKSIRGGGKKCCCCGRY